MVKPRDNLREEFENAWSGALDVWSSLTQLRPPILCANKKEAREEGLSDSFAMIRLVDHRIVIALMDVQEGGFASYAREILAHEIGHHVYVPANLEDNASLLSGVRVALGDKARWAPLLCNLYADQLINHHLFTEHDFDMPGLYQLMSSGQAPASGAWQLYLRTYEILWGLVEGSLSGSGRRQQKVSSDAAAAASIIRAYARDWLQGAEPFAVMYYKYLDDEKEVIRLRANLGGMADTLDAGEGGGVPMGEIELPSGGEVDARVIPEPIQETIGPEQRYKSPLEYVEYARQLDPSLTDAGEIVAHYYRELALPYLIPFPLEESVQEALSIPLDTELWEPGDPIDEIDWVETSMVSPQVIPGVTTRKRVWGAEVSDELGRGPLDLYIGIDCSGSMADPSQTFSWPVLAGCVIALSAFRVGARVKAVLSGDPGDYLSTERFTDNEMEVLKVLVSYLGTGYAFGIGRMNEDFSSPRPSPTHILILSDDDIFPMLGEKKAKPSNWSVAEQAVTNGGGGGTMVLYSNSEWHAEEAKRLTAQGWQINYVTNERDLLAFAKEFSRATWVEKKVR